MYVGKLMITVLLVAATVGCATIIHGGTQDVQINSRPQKTRK